MSPTVIATIVGAVIALLGILGFWGKVKPKLVAARETAEALFTALDAVADGKLTPEEVEEIKKEAIEAIDAWKGEPTVIE